MIRKKKKSKTESYNNIPENISGWKNVIIVNESVIIRSFSGLFPLTVRVGADKQWR